MRSLDDVVTVQRISIFDGEDPKEELFHITAGEAISVATKSIKTLEALLPIYCDGLKIIKEGKITDDIKILKDSLGLFSNDDEVSEKAEKLQDAVVELVDAMNRWAGVESKVNIIWGL